MTGDLMQDTVNDGQLSTDELIPRCAGQLSVVRTSGVRYGTAPLRMTDARVGGRQWQRTNLILFDHCGGRVTSETHTTVLSTL